MYLSDSILTMKKHLLLAGLLCSGSLFAQITITNADMPSAGSHYLMDNATAPGGLNLGDTGPNFTWDFSALGVTGSGVDSFVSVSSTPFAYQFFFNNIFLYPDNKADFAAASQDLNIPSQIPITVTDVINYYKKPSSGYYGVGFGASISGIPTSVQYDPIDRIFQFPMTFGDNNSSPFSYLISIPTVGAYGQNKVRSNEVDGWGTLLLPNGASYSVLRVKSTLSGTDTLYVDALGFGFNLPSTSYEYKWVAAGIGVPVLQINATDLFGTAVPSTVKYLHTDNTSGIIPYESKKTLNLLHQNPVSNELSVVFNTDLGSEAKLNIIDLNGRTVMSKVFQAGKGKNQISLDLNGIAAGLYQLNLQQGAYSASSKLVVQP